MKHSSCAWNITYFCIIHAATKQFNFYVFSYSVCSEIRVNPKITGCLFETGPNSVSHLTRSLSAHGELRFSGDRVTFFTLFTWTPYLYE